MVLFLGGLWGPMFQLDHMKATVQNLRPHNGGGHQLQGASGQGPWPAGQKKKNAAPFIAWFWLFWSRPRHFGGLGWDTP